MARPALLVTALALLVLVPSATAAPRLRLLGAGSGVTDGRFVWLDAGLYDLRAGSSVDVGVPAGCEAMMRTVDKGRVLVRCPAGGSGFVYTLVNVVTGARHRIPGTENIEFFADEDVPPEFVGLTELGRYWASGALWCYHCGNVYVNLRTGRVVAVDDRDADYERDPDSRKLRQLPQSPPAPVVRVEGSRIRITDRVAGRAGVWRFSRAVKVAASATATLDPPGFVVATNPAERATIWFAPLSAAP